MFLHITLSTALLTTHYQTYIACNNKRTAYKQITPLPKHIFNKMFIFRPHHTMSGLDRQIHLSLNRLFHWIYPLQYLRHYIHKLIGRQTSLLGFKLLQELCGSHRLPHQVTPHCVFCDTRVTAGHTYLFSSGANTICSAEITVLPCLQKGNKTKYRINPGRYYS